jgi:LPXTG-motif cell wall-anchored protein
MSPGNDPHSEYTLRREARLNDVQQYAKFFFRIAQARLATAITFVLVAWMGWWRGLFSGSWLLVPVMGFLILVIIHARLDEKKKRAEKAVHFYDDGLARIEDRWAGRGNSEKTFVDAAHLFAADLDIFGEASLFELLCTARTRSGERTLASWLTSPVDRSEVLARQDAVEELRHRLDLREDLATLASKIRSSIHPDRIIGWGESPPALTSRWARVAAPFLATGTFSAVGAVWYSGTDDAWLVLAGLLVLASLFGLFYRKRVLIVVAAAEEQEHDLELLSQILLRLEKEEFRSPRLRELRSSLDTDGLAPSSQIARFTRLSSVHTMRGSELPFALVLLFVLQGILILPFSFSMWSTQFAFALEAWRRRCGSSIRHWVSIVGEFEAMCALAGFAYEHPEDPFPDVVEQGPVFEGDDLGHPLIARTRSVANTVRLGVEPQLLVVSGSNMSGKTTLLRTVGVNTVLALAGAPVRARRLRLSPLAVGAAIQIQDSLQAGASQFYAEIQRIQHITELTGGGLPVLFLLDELLHGTNSHDRAIGAEAIVRSLMRRGAIGLATTHDLALAKIAEALHPGAANVHFEDQLKDGRMVFDYRMKQGVVQHSNALGLMKSLGLDV